MYFLGSWALSLNSEIPWPQFINDCSCFSLMSSWLLSLLHSYISFQFCSPLGSLNAVFWAQFQALEIVSIWPQTECLFGKPKDFCLWLALLLCIRNFPSFVHPFLVIKKCASSNLTSRSWPRDLWMLLGIVASLWSHRLRLCLCSSLPLMVGSKGASVADPCR